MRLFITSILVWSGLLANCQSDWSTLFSADPELSDGYFIIDQAKALALGVEEVRVDIVANETLPNRQIRTSVIETLVFEDNYYARTDFSRWAVLEDPFRITYVAHGLDANGAPVVEIQSIPVGSQPWPEACRETCESYTHAYTLVAYSDDVEAVIEIQNGTVNGEVARLYVRASYWQDFQNMFDPMIDFGIGGGEWSAIVQDEIQTDVIRLDYPTQLPPPGARDYMGYPLGSAVTEDVYAVKKGKGPWEGLYAYTNEMAAQAVCNGQGAGHLRMAYNADGLVQNALENLYMEPLVCHGMVASGSGSTWGSGYSGWCPGNDNINTDLPGDVAEWVIGILECEQNTWPGFTFETVPGYGGEGANGGYLLSDVTNVIISHLTDMSRNEVISIPVKGIGDPKLLKVNKTEVPAGLYEFMLVMNDGRIISRFVEFDGPITLIADFASFTNVNIYPVPVKDKVFAIDFDLPAPTAISLTIVNNYGNPCYSKSLDFELPGKNKHIVEMGAIWPDGLYHAVFQYADGSSESVSFMVDI